MLEALFLYIPCLLLAACVSSLPLEATHSPIYFTDAFARTFILHMCAATESHQPEICLGKAFKNVTVKRQIAVNCDIIPFVDTCSGYSAVSHDQRAILLAFRGTVGDPELIIESYQTVFKSRTAWIGGGVVGSYFANAYFKILNAGMKDDIITLVNSYPNYELWIAGHSLGGAMASLAASWIVTNGLFNAKNIRMVTFGQPRTGDKTYADKHDLLIPYKYRVTHHRDPVPHLPFEGLENYHHHLAEIFYNNDMTTPDDYIECDEQEGRACSDGHIDNDPNDHTRYFDKPVEEWGHTNCPN